ARFEPCGLTTMYAMRYGSLPITRAVGGLVDTVEDAGMVKAEPNGGSGFTFGEATADGLGRCLARATSWYQDNSAWKQLQRSAMRQDFSWEQSARRYLDVYEALLGRPITHDQSSALVDDLTPPAMICDAI
ncbi:MAG TPA: starch synthase, partial [Methyloceanibacter sp.]|nr:starch synthase [Methyloceanibacter sp.]